MHLKKEVTLKELAGFINADISDEPDHIVNDISEPESADERSVVYLSNKKFIEKVNNSKAKAVLTSDKIASGSLTDKILLVSKDLEDSFNKLLEFFEYKEKFSPCISDKASIASGTAVSKDCRVEDFVAIKDGTSIEKNTIIHSFVYIGKNVKIGKNCTIHSNVSIYDGTVIGNNVIIHCNTVIGSDGFGYLQKEGRNIKVPQIGNVVIEDNVEIGSNTSIDRATIGSTVIRKGVKIDNLVQIAHNVTIGENSIIASQTGVSGSSTVGKNCILAGQVGVADHAHIEDNVIVGAKTGVPSRVVRSEEKMIFGTPGRTILKAKRIEAIAGKLPEFYQEFNELKKLVKDKLK